jgi:hypothetical protein
MSPHQTLYPSIDPTMIEEATRRARRERSEAVWRMLSRIFPSVGDEPEKEPDEARQLLPGRAAHI